MSENDNDDLLDLFLEESEDRLEELNHDLMSLEDDPSNGETLYSLMRNFHTIKGNSGLFDFTHLKEISHRLEDMLDILKARPEIVDREIMDILFEGGDILQSIFRGVKEGDGSKELTPRHRSFLERLSDSITKISAEGLDIEENVNSLIDQVEDALKELEDAFDFSEIQKSIDKVKLCLGEQKTEEAPIGEGDMVPWFLGDIEVTTSIHIIEKNINSVGEGILDPDQTGNFFDEVEKLLKAARSLGEPNLEEILNESNEAMSTFRDLGLDFDELQAEYYRETLNVIRPYLNTGEDEDSKLEGKAEETKTERRKETRVVKKTVRIEEAKLDSFLYSVGEIITIGEVFNHLQKRIATVITDDIDLMREFKTSNTSLASHVFSLQNSLMDVRRVELNNIMGSLGRMVRDASISLGKDIEFTLEGEDSVVDKSLLDDINSSLVHLVRNSVDHGIELPEERSKNGKSEKANISVEAENVDGYLLLKVKDDGRGINSDSIKAKAVELGIISKEYAAKMPDDEANLLIFNEGLSTAKTVTDISGRGVGMSVVIEKIKKIGGGIDVKTTRNKGTEVIMRIPLSIMLSVIEGLVLKVSDTGFIIPIRYVVETFSIETSQIRSVRGEGEYVLLRGKLFPLVRLNKYFGMKNLNGKEGNCVVILIQSSMGRLCLLVDDILDHQQAVIKTIGGLEKTPCILGGSLLGDGTIGLVLDAEELIASWKGSKGK